MLGLINKAVIKINKSDRFKRIVSNTVNGDDIENQELLKISSLVGFIHGEKLKLLYSFNNDFEQGINLDTGIIIGITNYRVFKSDKRLLCFALRKDISTVYHHQRNVFVWDSVECVMKHSRPESFGIYHKDACAFFCEYLIANKCDDPYIIAAPNPSLIEKAHLRVDIPQTPQNPRNNEVQVEGMKNANNNTPSDLSHEKEGKKKDDSKNEKDESEEREFDIINGVLSDKESPP